MRHQTEAQTLAFYQFHAWPLIKYLYQQAGLKEPERFDHLVEGPRLVNALIAKGFDLRISVVNNRQEETWPG